MEGEPVNSLVLGKVRRVIRRKVGAWVGGSLYSLDQTLAAMAARPFELHLELTNICNASCVFCPYQFQERSTGFDGSVIACACIAAMDAVPDLRIGSILENDLLEIYSGEAMHQLRDQFRANGSLNATCAKCDAYQDCELYRTNEGRIRAELNRKRACGTICKRSDRAKIPFAGG